MSRILHFLNNFVRMKRWERRWGNPIRAGDEPNPFYGLNVTPVPRAKKEDVGRPVILGIGIDILHLPRLQQLGHRRQVRRATAKSESASKNAALDRLAKRILCNSEWKEYEQLVQQQIDTTQLERYVAVRWSAKEAAYKALYPKYVVSWKDLRVYKPVSAGPIDCVDLADLEEQGIRSKKPELSFSDEWRSKVPERTSIPKLHLSVSHDGEYVIANVLAEGNTAE